MDNNHATLAETLWSAPSGRSVRIGRHAVLAGGGALALAISAQVFVPWIPVPFTMQTFVVLVLGIAYGPVLGGITGGLYLLLGASGLPVFAEGSSRVALAGPTAGYLIGFAVAMATIGFVARRGWDRNASGVIIAVIIGEVIIFGLGVAWLARVLGSWAEAVAVGLVPFVWTELIKMALVVAVVPAVWSRVLRFNQ